MPSRFIHVVTNGRISFFLWPSNTPLYIYTTSSLCIHLLFYSLLGCPHVLAVVNNAAMNIEVHVSLWFINSKTPFFSHFNIPEIRSVLQLIVNYNLFVKHLSWCNCWNMQEFNHSNSYCHHFGWVICTVDTISVKFSCYLKHLQNIIPSFAIEMKNYCICKRHRAARHGFDIDEGSNSSVGIKKYQHQNLQNRCLWLGKSQQQ